MSTVNFDVTIHTVSPIHLGSGREDVNLDAEVVADACGLPYFPARRFKGLLYESALEVTEMAELAGGRFASPELLEELFHHSSESQVQLTVPNFYLKAEGGYETISREWRSLMERYPGVFRPSDVLETYTSIRYQTRLEDGVAKDGSLHNMRVVNAGLDFTGTLELTDSTEAHVRLLALALRNLSIAGMKRSRGLGRISCRALLSDGRTGQDVVAAALDEEAV